MCWAEKETPKLGGNRKEKPKHILWERIDSFISTVGLIEGGELSFYLQVAPLIWLVQCLGSDCNDYWHFQELKDYFYFILENKMVINAWELAYIITRLVSLFSLFTYIFLWVSFWQNFCFPLAWFLKQKP